MYGIKETLLLKKILPVFYFQCNKCHVRLSLFVFLAPKEDTEAAAGHQEVLEI